MKKRKKKLCILILITIFILLLNIVFKNIFNEYTMSLFLGVLFVISVIYFGFEKFKNIYEKKIILSTLLFSIAFLIFIYGLGLFTGYAKTIYRLTPFNIIKNIFPVLLLIVVEELLRYNFLSKTKNDKLLNWFTIFLFTLVDVSLTIHMYDQSNLSNILKLMTIVVLPSISKNYVLNRFSYYYGYFSCMCYQMIMNSYVYLFPIVPNLGYYLNSIVMFLIPLIINVIMENIYPKKGKRFHKKKDLKKNKIINIICIFLVLVIVGLCSNLFPYWIATIGSGSMSPTINVGDAIIIDKTFAKNLDRLQVGDILVFKVKDSIYTHRIVDIHKKNNQYQINTKGDRKGNVTDNWVVTDDGVVGVVKCKIPYIGYPTVILNQMIEKNKKEGNNEK